MALTRKFIETIKSRADRDPEFRREMLKSAMDCFLSGEADIGRLTLRDYVNATMGFEKLGQDLEMNPTSIMRMLSAKGNPSSKNLFEIFGYLQAHEGIALNVFVPENGVQEKTLSKPSR